MGDLPPFARALQQRKYGIPPPNNNRVSPREASRTRQSLQDPNFYEIEDNISLASDMGKNQGSKSSEKLETMIADLHDQIEALREENEYLRSRSGTDYKQNSSNSEDKTLIENLQSQLFDERQKNKNMIDQISILEQLLDGKTQVTEAKESMIVRLQGEYTQLAEDYQKALDQISLQTTQLRQARSAITEIGSGYEESFMPKPRQQPIRSSYDIPHDPYVRDDFNSPRGKSEPVPSRDNVDLNDSLDFYPPKRTYEPPVPETVPKQQLKPSAIRDNIQFDDYDHTRFTINTDRMSVEDMKGTLQQLQEERSEKERLFAKAIPKGANKSQARNEKEALENDIEDLSRNISKLKLSLKTSGANF